MFLLKNQMLKILCIAHIFTILKAQDEIRNPFLCKGERQGRVTCVPFQPVNAIQKALSPSTQLGLSKAELEKRIQLSQSFASSASYKPMSDQERERTIHILMMVSKKSLPSGYTANDYNKTELIDNDLNNGISCIKNTLKKLKQEEIKLYHSIAFTCSVIYRLSNRIASLEHTSQNLLYQIYNTEHDISNESDKLYETQLAELKKRDAERKHHNTALKKFHLILNAVRENIMLHEVMLSTIENITLQKQEIENVELIERQKLLLLFIQEKQTIETEKMLYAPRKPFRTITNYPMLSEKKRKELKRL